MLRGAHATSSGHPVIETGPLVLFDGVCNLCSWSVRFLASRDRAGQLWFASVQSETGQRLLAAHDLPTDRFDSFLFLEAGRLHEKSAAFFRLVGYMKFPWPLLTIGRLVPRVVADWLYDRVARNRYRLFGRRETCMIPRPELARRFLS